MKKILLALLMVTACVFNTNAQLPDGTIAPDFTLTDIDGQEHHLYSYLNEGKTVILDFSATWCPPCWDYHTAGELETLYEDWGPDGEDKVMVIMIEGDGNTSYECLFGSNGCIDPNHSNQSMGNWVEGTHYPIIEGESITSAYQIGYWPTVYAVCPDRLVTEIQPQTTSWIKDFAEVSCPPASGQNNVRLLYQGNAPCGDFTPTVMLQNLGLETLTNITLDVKVDGANVQTVNWTGNLPTYTSEDVTFDMISGVVSQDIMIEASAPNGMSDEDMTNNAAEIPKVNTTDSKALTLTIVTDQYGYETYWEFMSDSGEVLYSGGNPQATAGGNGQAQGGYAANETNTIDIVLPQDGCYSFRIIDDYGDGMCCAYGNGGFTLTAEDGSIVFSGGEFGAEVVESLHVGEVAAAAPVANFSASVETDGATVTVSDNSSNAVNWLWNFGDGSTFTGQNPPPHTYDESGTYTITLTVINADGANAQFMQDVTVEVTDTNIEDLTFVNALNVFPIPANDILNIVFDLASNHNITIEVTDVTGKVLNTQNNNYNKGNNAVQINTTDLANGLYVVTFKSNNEVASQRFVVSR